jgi:hypothetical protein
MRTKPRWRCPRNRRLRAEARRLICPPRGAAGAEGAARGRVQRIGQLRLPPLRRLQRTAHHRRAVRPAAGCRGGAARRRSPRRPDLHHRAEIEHRDAVADGLHHGEVVADEKVGQAELALEVGQQVQHLRLHRHVERRDRFVEDQDARVGGQRPGDADALRLPAGELVRVAVEELLAQVHGGEDLGDRARRGRRRPCRAGSQRRLHDLADRLARVQRGDRVLEDILDLLAELRRVGGVERRALDLDMPRSGRLQRPTSIRASVDLPQPDSPTMPSVSPLCTVRSRAAPRAPAPSAGRRGACRPERSWRGR